MNHIGPLEGLPIACTLTPGAGGEQLARWQQFDAEYALTRNTQPGQITVHYASNDDSRARLRALVAVESQCCSFVDWSIDDTHDDLRLVVRGSDDAIAALSIA